MLFRTAQTELPRPFPGVLAGFCESGKVLRTKKQNLLLLLEVSRRGVYNKKTFCNRGKRQAPRAAPLGFRPRFPRRAKPGKSRGIYKKSTKRGLTAMWKSNALSRIAWANCALFAYNTTYVRDG